MLILWVLYVIYVSCLSCFLVCSLQPCGHLLGKGWPLGSFVCDVFCDFVTFTCSVLGQVWYLIGSIPNLCLLTYFEMNAIWVSTIMHLAIPNIIAIIEWRPFVLLFRPNQKCVCNLI